MVPQPRINLWWVVSVMNEKLTEKSLVFQWFFRIPDLRSVAVALLKIEPE